MLHVNMNTHLLYLILKNKRLKKIWLSMNDMLFVFLNRQASHFYLIYQISRDIRQADWQTFICCDDNYESFSMSDYSFSNLHVFIIFFLLCAHLINLYSQIFYSFEILNYFSHSTYRTLSKTFVSLYF